MRPFLFLPIAMFGAVGCASRPDGAVPDVIEDIDLGWEVSTSITTAGTVAWVATEDTADASIEYGLTTAYGMLAPQLTPGEIVLLGLLPGTTYHYRLVGPGWVTEDRTLITGPAPEDLQELKLLESDGSDWGAFVLTTTFEVGKPAQLQVLDPQLRPVWWRLATSFVWKAKFSADRKSIVYLEGTGGFEAEIVRVALTGEVLARIPVPNGHHDFVELPNGDFAYLASTMREWNGWQVVGDQIVEVDSSGGTTIVWDAFDDLTPVEEEHWPGELSSLGADWFHANALVYDARDGSFLVSSYYLKSIYKIDARSGDIQWQLGGEGGEFSFPDDRGFGTQHAPELTADGILLFDNGAASTGSRVVQYSLNAQTRVASRVAEYPHPTGAWVGTMGDASRMPSGGVASTWAERGEAIVFNEAGEVAWHADVDSGSMIFGMDVFDSFYP